MNQVAPYYCVQPHLQPFRELLKKKTPWYWDGLLRKLFEESREIISKKVVEGIELFDKTRWTAVSTDWSKMGVGYFLSQKHCHCLEITPTRYYTQGCDKLLVCTDHKPLLGVCSMTEVWSPLTTHGYCA